MANEPEVEFEEGVQPQKGSKNLIIGVVAVVVLMGGAWAYVHFTSAGDEEAGGAAQAKEVGNPGEVGEFIPLKSFVVNLNAERSNRYLKVTLQLEMAQEGMQEEVTKRIPLIRHKVITYLTGLDVGDVRGAETKDVIRKKLVERVNKAFGVEGIVRNVLFTEFVVQ
jgi:flagellar FliL protein